jgi:hypothetical protein
MFCLYLAYSVGSEQIGSGSDFRMDFGVTNGGYYVVLGREPK